MKKIIAALLGAFVLCACLAHAGAKGELSEGTQIAAVIDAAYPGVRIDQLQRWGGTAAAVFAHEGRNILCVLEDEGSGWQITVNNPTALLQDQLLPNLLLDSDNALFWSYALGSSSFGAHKSADGRWGAVSQLYREAPGGKLVEHEILYSGGALEHRVGVYDENENPLEPWRTEAELPAAFLETCIALADFDASRFPVYETVEYEGQWPPRAFIAECAQELLPGYTFAGGALADGRLQLLVDSPDGERVFVGVSGEAENRLTISAPLPADTVYGVENFTTSLGIAGLCVTPQYHEASGRWGVGSVLAPDGELRIGQHCVFEASDRNTMLFGDHPWGDVAAIDWGTLPASFEAAKAYVNTHRWMIVHNPDPSDRLNLRAQPDRSSASLGRYYNGTPVQVLSLDGDWAHVLAGGAQGYMMKKYLQSAYGEVTLEHMPQLQARGETVVLYETADLTSACETVAASANMRVIGVVSDSFYHVWFPVEDKYGYVRQDALWPGNG